jgi:lysophospholipase L1-like esterase
VEWIDMNLLRDHFDPEKFIDRIHLNSEGYRVMAERVAEKIMADGLLEPLPE